MKTIETDDSGPVRRLARSAGVFLLAVAVVLSVTAAPADQRSASPVGEASGIVVTGTTAIALAVGAGAAGAVGGYALSEVLSDNTDDLAGVDDAETKLRMYSLADQKEVDNKLLEDSSMQGASGSKLPALADGKLAAVKAINNGSSKIDAKIEGRTAARDYVAARQAHLVKSHAVAMQAAKNLRNTSQNEEVGYGPKVARGTYGGIKDFREIEVTLANGSTLNTSVPLYKDNTGGGTAAYYLNTPFPQDKVSYNGSGVNGYEAGTYNTIMPSTSIDGESYPQVNIGNEIGFYDAWTKWEQVQNDAADNIGVFVDESYTEISDGNVSEGELYDPYVQARNLSPDDDYQTWALSSLAATGILPPEDLDGFKNMTVTVNDNRTYTGILLSESEPDGGFAVGTTYLAGNYSGTVAVQTPEQTVTLEDSDNFTVEAVTATNGSGLNTSTIRYPDANVSSTNINEYLNTSERLQVTDERIQARQESLRGGLGGGGLLPEVGFDSPLALAGVAGVAGLSLYALGSFGGGGGGSTVNINDRVRKRRRRER